MSQEPGVTAYSIAEPFGRALPKVREALVHAELCIFGELDVAQRIHRELSLGFEPCRIILVDTPYLLLESVTLDRSGALVLPLRLLVYASGSLTRIQWLNLDTLEGSNLPACAAGPLHKLQNTLCRAFEPIALRADLRSIAS